MQVALKAGSCAAKYYEPRQVREEAAVSKFLRVSQENLAGANCTGGACYHMSKLGARSYKLNFKIFFLGLNCYELYFFLQEMAPSNIF